MSHYDRIVKDRKLVLPFRPVYYLAPREGPGWNGSPGTGPKLCPQQSRPNAVKSGLHILQRRMKLCPILGAGWEQHDAVRCTQKGSSRRTERL